MSDINQLAKELSDLLAPHLVLSDERSKEFYGRDWIKDFSPAPSLVVLPESAEQVKLVVTTCARHGVAIVPSGGRTGLSGGATATKGEVILSLERMRSVLEVNPIDRTIRCQAGAPLERIQTEAAQHDLYFPVDFSSRGSAQIGGNIATNAGGIRVIRYGNMREWVVGLKVVTGRGDILELNGSLWKNNTGYDLRSLFVGSEGTLGVIVEATLKLTSPPKDTTRVLCGLASNEAVLPLLTFCRSKLRELSAFEFIDASAFSEVIKHRQLRNPLSDLYAAYVLVEVELNSPDSAERVTEAFGDAYENGLIQDVVVSESSAQSQELMNIRDLISETLSMHYTLHKNDISVPVPAIPAFLSELHTSIGEAYAGFKVVVFGHVGDGNLHVNVLKPSNITDDEFWKSCHESDRTIFSTVKKFKGSISAEHGVGLLKRDFIHYSRTTEELEMMRGIKRVFDPLNIMNPGKVLPDPGHTAP
jgi:FAD/FMN-containing dehydrogenase